MRNRFTFVHYGTPKLNLAVFISKLKKVKGIFVFDRQFCLIPDFLRQGFVEIGLV